MVPIRAKHNYDLFAWRSNQLTSSLNDNCRQLSFIQLHHFRILKDISGTNRVRNDLSKNLFYLKVTRSKQFLSEIISCSKAQDQEEKTDTLISTNHITGKKNIVPILVCYRMQERAPPKWPSSMGILTTALTMVSQKLFRISLILTMQCLLLLKPWGSEILRTLIANSTDMFASLMVYQLLPQFLQKS